MSKPTRNGIAVILRNKANPAQFLIVKRPAEGGDLDGFWGLPAARMQDGELPEDAARRVCREKLGCDAVPIRLIGTMFQKRTVYDMFFMDVEMLLTGTAQPDVAKARTNNTVYVDQRWTTNAKLLLSAARHGSCCSTLFLTDQGLLSKDDWVVSLEGSPVVTAA
jgi:8-oxo-dGTP pyrophosphatase MutT (NUDIX family)